MKNWIKRHKKLLILIIVIIVLAVAALLIIPRVFKKEDTSQHETKQTTMELTKMDLTTSISATGTIESAKTKVVSADVNEVKVKKVLVSEGDDVVKGQSLISFDESDLEDALEEAQENLSDAKTQAANDLASAKRQLSDAQDTYTSGKKTQASNVASAKKAYLKAKKNVASAKTATEKAEAKEKLSEAKSAYEQAKQEQKTTNKQNKSSVESAKDSVTSTQTNNKKSIREAEQSVEDAKETLEACAVTAPMDGTVTAIGVEAGDTYSGGDLIEISDCTNLQVTTTVDEYDISEVEKGQKVVILTDATDDEELEGKITYVAQTMGSSLSSGSSDSAGGGATTTTTTSGSGYEVRIKMTSTNDKLRVGMTAKCSIIEEEAEDVYAVPYDAIHTNTNGDSVLYVTDSSGTRSEVVVTQGMESDYYVEVSGDGLSEGLQVIIPTDSTSTSSSDDDSSSGSLDSLFGAGSSGGGKQNMQGGGGRGSQGGSGMPGM